jgi:hypothetical protein
MALSLFSGRYMKSRLVFLFVVVAGVGVIGEDGFALAFGSDVPHDGNLGMERLGGEDGP